MAPGKAGFVKPPSTNLSHDRRMLGGNDHRTATEGAARNGRLWELVLVLATVVLSGILAGLYFVSEQLSFLVACLLLVLATIAAILGRHPHRMKLLIAWMPAAGPAGEGRRDAGSLFRLLTGRAAKTAGIAIWLLAWGVTTYLFLQVADNVNISGLAIFILIGAASPFILYFLLEGGVKRLGGRIREP